MYYICSSEHKYINLYSGKFLQNQGKFAAESEHSCKTACMPNFLLILERQSPSQMLHSGGLQILYITRNTKLQVWTKCQLFISTSLVTS